MLMASHLVAQEPAGLVLAQNGNPAATIVLAENPTAAAQVAAFELQHYIQKISGAVLPISRNSAVEGSRILVGESKAALELGYANKDFAEQEYAVKTFPNALLLMGHDGPRRGEARGEDGADFSAVDTEGFLWSAQWYGVQVVRYDPDGTVERRTEVRLRWPGPHRSLHHYRRRLLAQRVQAARLRSGEG